MAAPTSDIVQKLWNLCHVLRDDGVAYQQYVTELVFLLFLKMAKETGRETELPKATASKVGWALPAGDGGWASVGHPRGFRRRTTGTRREAMRRSSRRPHPALPRAPLPPATGRRGSAHAGRFTDDCAAARGEVCATSDAWPRFVSERAVENKPWEQCRCVGVVVGLDVW